MKQDYFTLNKHEILRTIQKYEFLSQEQLKEILHQLKDKSLLSSSLSFNSFLLKLIDEGLAQKSITIRGHLKTRYSLRGDFNIYDFCNSLEKNSFFSMSTALNLQGLSDFRSDYIFVSKERSTRIEQGSITLNQENIDNAFSKKPRRTNAYDKIDNHIVVLLEANNTDGFGIVEYDRYRVSSINRAFVEMITNIHYFQSSQNLIQVLENIKNRLDIDKIYTIIEKFDFIYPYFQLAGFYLEKIGFPKVELEKFYTKRSELNFYTQKNKNQYGFDGYWKVYY